MTSQGDFTPPVKAGYKSDGAFHRRNWRALTDFMRTNFVTNDHLQDGSITEAKIEDLAVTNAKIQSLEVDKLTTGSLNADVILAAVIKTADSGQRVEIDVNGIRLNDGANDVVNIPVSGDASFTGGVTASSLRSDATTLAGDTTVDGSGHMRFAQGVADPSVSPTIAWTYTQTTLTGAPAVRGVDCDLTDMQLLGCYPDGYTVGGWPLAGGGLDWTFPLLYKPYGIVRLGSYIYISALSGGSVYLYKYPLIPGTGEIDVPVAASRSFALGSAPFTNFDHLAGMTSDGTDIYVCWVKTTNDVVLSKFSSSVLTFTSSTTLDTGLETANRHVYDIEHQNVDGGRWWAVWANATAGTFGVRAYDSTPSHLTAEDFALPGDSRGICYSGSEFITVPSNAAYYRSHSNWRSSQTIEHVKYAWYDSGGSYESLTSAQSYATYVQRAFLRVSWSAFPGSADSVRVYFLENNVGTIPAAGAMFRQGTETGTSQTYGTYAAGGADVTTSTFPAATPARLTLPVKSSAPSSPETGEIYFDSSTSKARIWDGGAWNALW